MNNNDKEDKWISIEDKLPEKNNEVLITDGYSVWGGFSREYSQNEEGWCWFDNSEEGYFNTDEITHWMPLPEPPKGENNES